jgi:hypothetical protein
VASGRDARLDESCSAANWSSLPSALTGDLGETIASKRAHASINKLGDDEDAAERALGLAHVFEIYASVMSADGTRALGAYEIYAKPERAESFIASTKRVIWIAVIAVFAVLYAALALLVRRASSTMQRQAITLRGGSGSGGPGLPGGAVRACRGGCVLRSVRAAAVGVRA